MNVSPEFVKKVRQWVILDHQLNSLTDKARTVRIEKQALSNEICDHMISNGMENSALSLTGGNVARVSHRTEFAPLTFSYIRECLAEVVEEEEQVEFLIELLRSRRAVKSVVELKIRDGKPRKSAGRRSRSNSLAELEEDVAN